MKNVMIMAATVLALAACETNFSRGPSGAEAKCNQVMIASQDFKGRLVRDVKRQVAENVYLQSVPIIYGQSAIANGTAQRGTLVMEVNRPLNSPQNVIDAAPVTNLYCFN